MLPPLDIDGAAFATARAQQRQRNRADRAAARVAAAKARDAFVEEAMTLYAVGPAVGPADADALEDVAARVVGLVRGLEPLMDALVIARDQAVWRGPVLQRVRSRFDEVNLAELVGEAVSQAMLSEAAAALLATAIRAAD